MAESADLDKKKRSLYGEHGLDHFSLGNLFNLGHNPELFSQFDHHDSSLQYKTIETYAQKEQPLDTKDNYEYQLAINQFNSNQIPVIKGFETQPYPLQAEKNIAIPELHPLLFSVNKPYPILAQQTYPATILKSVPLQIETPIPYSIGAYAFGGPINIPANIQQALPSGQTFLQPLETRLSQQNVQTAQVKAPKAIGSGSLGVTRLPNGAYVLGSGSLGYSTGAEQNINRSYRN